MEKGEFDFLIVSKPLQTIFHLEVDRTCSKNTSDNAAKQLDRGLKMVQDNIPFPEQENWKYVRLMYFEFNYKKNSIVCPECQKFVLGPTKDIWVEITKKIENPTNEIQSKSTYLNILKMFLYDMFKQETSATTEQLIKETRKISEPMRTSKNIFFWSKEQLNVIKATKYAKRVALTSEFGTGKTILLKEKAKKILGKTKKEKRKMKDEDEAKQLEPKDQKVVFVIFEGGATETILKQEYTAQFSETGASVYGISGRTGDINT
jgi:hypothetical protein